MKTKLMLIGIPTLVIFFIIGWNGIEVEGILTEGECSISYDYYYIEPVVKNAWECSPFGLTTPCGTDSRQVKHNAQVNVIQCLCNNISDNDSIILDYYNNKFDRYLEGEIQSNDSEFICKDGAKPFLRM